MKNERYLYHITDQKKAKTILTEGLIPGLGENSQICGEEERTIYLSDWHSIPYWQILLGKSTVLRVKKPEETAITSYDYNGYSEYLTAIEIPPKQITEYQSSQARIKPAMEDLCLRYLWVLSDVTRQCADYYSRTERDLTEEELIRQLSVMNTILTRLDYKGCDRKAILAEIRAIGENGVFAFTDRYFDTEERLWSQLIRYPDDRIKPYRSRLYEQILYLFSDEQRYCNTGGYCF